MKKLTWLVLFLIIFGCASTLSRTEAYSVLPIEFDEFEKMREAEYRLIALPYPAELNSLEQGTAWELMIRFPDGKMQTVIATFFSYWDEEKKTLSFLMGEEIGGTLFAITNQDVSSAKGILLSHDHNYCANIETRAMTRCPDMDLFDWLGAAELTKFTATIKPDSEQDAKLLATFDQAMKRLSTAENNFAMSANYLALIKKQDRRNWSIVRIATTSVLSGTVISLIATPIVGVVSGALLASTQSINEAAAPPDTNYSEYASGLARREELQVMKSALKNAESRLRRIETEKQSAKK